MLNQFNQLVFNPYILTKQGVWMFRGAKLYKIKTGLYILR